MGYFWACALAALVALAPAALAGDVTRDGACIGSTCVGPGTCAPDVACVPAGCAPAASCRGDVGADASACGRNASIDGRTCQLYVSTAAGAGHSVGTPLTGSAPVGRAEASVSLSDGNVYLFHLPNSWASPSADVGASVLGVDAGRTSVAAYRSEMRVEEGQPNALAQALHGEGHTYRQVLVMVRHDSAASSQSYVAGVVFLDELPESCSVRSATGNVREVRCPRVSGLL